MTRQPPPPDEPALDRWRPEVRRAMPQAGADLVEEVAAHVAERWQRARAAGLSPAAADAQVVVELDEWRAMSRPRDGWSARAAAWRHGWLADARYAVRAMRLRPLHTAAAILLTTFGTMAAVVAFAIVYGVLQRPLAYPDSERLAVLFQVHRGEQTQISYPDFADLAGAPVFDGAAVIGAGRGSLRIGERIERVNLLEMEARGYALLGARPLVGRLLDERDGGRPVAMISHRLWSGHLGADPNVVGRALWLSGRDYVVVGVLPPGFDFELPVTATLRLERHDLWTVFDPASPFVARRDVSTFEALVRLAPATTLDEAQAAADAIGRRLALDHPATNAGRTFRVTPLKAQMVGAARRPLLLGGAAAMATLLIALANLSTLAMIRLTARQPELAIREALGAGSMRLRRQLFTEHLLAVATGSAAGWLLALGLTRTLVAAESAHLPRAEAIRFDPPVQAFAVALAAIVAVVLSLLPLRVARGAGALRESGRVAGRHAHGLRRALVVAELALALAFSAGGALLGVSLARLSATDPGFDAAGVVSARVSAYPARYPRQEHVEAFVGRTVEQLAGLPGIGSAAAGSSLPLSGQTTGTGVLVEGRATPAASRQGAGWQFVTPGYFATLGMPLTRGRDFSLADRRHGGHVTIINEALARALFGGEDPIGRRITSGDGDADDDWHEVVGVVADSRHHSLDAPPAPRIYDLFGEHWGRTMYLVARARQEEAAALIPAVRRAVRAIDPEAPVFEAATMEALVARSAAPYRLAAALAAGGGLVAVLLALLGVYAMAAAAVAERRREISVRAALGAAPRDLVRLVLGDAALTGLAGALAGIAGAAAISRSLVSQLFGVHPADAALVVPAIAALVLAAGMAATWPAARRAASADPLIAMRAE